MALGTAGAALAQQELRTARAALTAFSVNLGAARGRGVRMEGFEVMQGGTEALASRLTFA